MAGDPAQEERLKLLQDGRVYPVGRVLRETFDAENHESLGTDVTGLMLDLSKLPYGDEEGPRTSRPAAGTRGRPLHETTPRRVFWRLGGLFGRR